MLGETHRRLAYEIANELKLDREYAKLLSAGSMDPDGWVDFPHNHGKELLIIRNLLEARLMFLNDDDECYHNLGVALHYIEDRWTAHPRKDEKYSEWEKQIEKEQLQDDSNLKEYILNASIPEKTKKAYLFFTQLMNDGFKCITKTEMDYLRQSVEQYENYYNYLNEDIGRVCLFALLPPPSSFRTQILDLNCSFRICSKVASAIVMKPSLEDPQDKNLNKLKAKTEGFPESYLKPNFSVKTIGEITYVFDIAQDLESLKGDEEFSIAKFMVKEEVNEEVLEKHIFTTRKKIVPREVETEKYRLDIVKKNSIQIVYIACPSKQAALYVKEIIKKHSTPSMEYRNEREYIEKLVSDHGIKGGIFLTLKASSHLPKLTPDSSVSFLDELRRTRIPDSPEEIEEILLEYSNDLEKLNSLTTNSDSFSNMPRGNWFSRVDLEGALSKIEEVFSILSNDAIKQQVFSFTRTEALFPDSSF